MYDLYDFPRNRQPKGRLMTQEKPWRPSGPWNPPPRKPWRPSCPWNPPPRNPTVPIRRMTIGENLRFIYFEVSYCFFFPDLQQKLERQRQLKDRRLPTDRKESSPRSPPHSWTNPHLRRGIVAEMPFHGSKPSNLKTERNMKIQMFTKTKYQI